MSETFDADLVESVARAIAINHHVDPDDVGPGNRHVIEIGGVPTIISDLRGPLWSGWTPDANAAIRAIVDFLREPSVAMHDAGVEVYNKYGFVPERIYLAILNEAVRQP